LRLQSIKADVANKQAQAEKARAAADAAREREGLTTLASKADRIKLMSTEIEAISNQVSGNASIMLQNGGPRRLRDMICANKYAELFGCPESYVRRYRAPVSDDASGQNATAVTSDTTEPNKGPSFDCSRARTADERTVCRSAELGRLDWEMANAFVKAGGRGNPRTARIKGKFMSGRRACGGDASCIRDVTRQAISDYSQL